MRSSFHHPRSKINQNKLTISPIFANNPRKEHVKSGDYKFDEISIGSNYSTADCQSQQEMPPSTSAQSLSQSYTQPNPYKSFYEKDQYCETTYHAYTTNSCMTSIFCNSLSNSKIDVDCTTAESLTRKTESLIEKLERFESKLDESKRLIENLRKERKDLISQVYLCMRHWILSFTCQADRIDAILNTEGSPKSKHRRIVSSGSSPGLVFSNQKPDRGTPHSEHSPMNKVWICIDYRLIRCVSSEAKRSQPLLWRARKRVWMQVLINEKFRTVLFWKWRGIEILTLIKRWDLFDKPAEGWQW